jgi:hypothetical protein
MHSVFCKEVNAEYRQTLRSRHYSAISGLIPRHKLVCTLAAAQVMQRRQRFGIKPDGIINFLIRSSLRRRLLSSGVCYADGFARQTFTLINFLIRSRLRRRLLSSGVCYADGFARQTSTLINFLIRSRLRRRLLSSGVCSPALGRERIGNGNKKW